MSLTRLTDHVHAWDSPGGQSNATVIAGPTMVVCIDALMSPTRSAELEAAAIDATGRPVDAVVLTHYHADHVMGVSGFQSDPLILGHRGTRDFLVVNGASERQRLLTALPALSGELDGVDAPVPSMTLDSSLQLHLGGGVEVHLVAVGPAHTPSDVIVHVPGEGVVATGDLAFNGIHPVFRDADVEGWRSAIGRVYDLAADHVVPGHGRVGGPPILGAMGAYVDQLLAAAQEAHAAGWGEAETAERTVLPDFDDWQRSDRLAQSIDRVLHTTFVR